MAWARSLVSRRGALDVREKREHGLRWWGPLGHERIDWPEVERARELSTAGCGDVERLPRRSCSWDKALGLRGRDSPRRGWEDGLVHKQAASAQAGEDLHERAHSVSQSRAHCPN